MKKEIYYIIIATLLLIISIMSLINTNKIGNLNKDLDSQKKLTNALIDEMRIVKKNGETIANKLTIQYDFNELQKNYNELSENQKELIDRIKGIDKNQSIISAALIETIFKIDSIKYSLNNNVLINENDSTLQFIHEDSDLKYDLLITNAFQANKLIKPTLKFNKFEAPNKYFITFQWDKNKRNNYPVSFSVTNTNPLFNTVNIDSYAIPELNKNEIDPNFWNKINNWTIKNKKIITVGGVCISAGAIVIITKSLLNSK